MILRFERDILFRSCRELERERKGLEANEKKIIADMKKDAKEGECHARAQPFCPALMIARRQNSPRQNSRQISYNHPQLDSKVLHHGLSAAGARPATHINGVNCCND